MYTKREKTVRSKRFTNELEPTVEQKEKNRVFSSKFGQKDDEFIKGEYFNALVEFTYFYFKGESFYLTQEGRKKLRMFDSYIDKGILEDFLRANRAEVEAVSVYEFDEKLHEDTIKEIAYSEGYAKGEESGYTTGYAKGEESGYTTGYAKGEESGYAKGEESGYAKGEESGYTMGYAKGEESGYINGEIYGRVKAYHELNISITEIASKVGISVDKVTEILNVQL